MPTAEPVGIHRDTAYDRWGAEGRTPVLSAELLALLEERVGIGEPSPSVPIGAVELPPAAELPADVIAAAGGAARFSAEPEDRIRHARGKSYADLIELRSGKLADAPDAVLAPPDAAAVEALLSACEKHRIAVVPFGGGTSVVGGVAPIRGGHERLISLDLSALRGLAIDHRSMTAALGPGLRGPDAEAGLGSAGLTLGHFPQSFEYATVGGFAATRSAGQASTGYGRFDELVTAVRMVGPRGTLATLQTPHTAAGPSLRELILGSEGVLGVITDVTVRVRATPEGRAYEAWIAPSFGGGIEIARAMAQSGTAPDVFRLSDRDETEVSLATAGLDGLKRWGLSRYLSLRRRGDGCMLIVGWEGEAEAVRRRRSLGRVALRRGGAVPIGRGAGRSWQRSRFEGPYLRDALIDHGILVETLETSHTYARAGELYAAVRAALAAEIEAASPSRRGVVMCHVSHVYRDGVSLYFTFVTQARSEAEIRQCRELKRVASEAIVGCGGTITHHHAVGRDHASYMRAEVGELGVDALRAVKDRLDPTGIMNPGKLIP